MRSEFNGSQLEVSPPTVAARGTFSLRRFGSEAALVMGAGAAGQLLSYLFHFLLSRRLGPDRYGTLVTLIAIAGILGVIGASLGTVVMQRTARLWASHLDASISQFLRSTSRFAAAVSLSVAAALLALSLLGGPYLHVTQASLWWLLAVYVALLLFMGFARGAAQGAHRFGTFAASLLGEGVMKAGASFAAVLAGWGVAGAVGGLIASGAVGLALAYAPLLGISRTTGGPQTTTDACASRTASQAQVGTDVLHSALGGDTLKVLGITATCSAFLFMDMIFAKHHFTPGEAGYFGAAGTLARTLPYGVGLIALLIMPKAAAARHVGRAPLAGVLASTAIASGATVLSGAAILAGAAHALVRVTYGTAFATAASFLPWYALDEALLAVWLIAVSYLMAVGEYRVFAFLIVAALLEGSCFALFGATPIRLLWIAIAFNAGMAPLVWLLAVRTLHGAAQATAPVGAETFS